MVAVSNCWCYYINATTSFWTLALCFLIFWCKHMGPLWWLISTTVLGWNYINLLEDAHGVLCLLPWKLVFNFRLPYFLPVIVELELVSTSFLVAISQSSWHPNSAWDYWRPWLTCGDGISCYCAEVDSFSIIGISFLRCGVMIVGTDRKSVV